MRSPHAQRPARGSQSAEPSALGRFDLSVRAARRSALHRDLREISGLAVTPDGRLFAHNDEQGVVSELVPCRGDIVKRFAIGRPPVRDDFEGIAIAGDRFFLVTSTGRLYETREGANGAFVTFRAIDTGFGRTCELEGLAFEPRDRVLLVGCKRPLRGPSRGRVTLFRWSLDRGAPATPPSITVPLDGDFRVTSVELDARTGHLVLAAGPQRLLSEMTSSRALLTRRLDPKLHGQPEGVTLIGDSLLVIADEGSTGPAMLTCYPRSR
jgi:uncharacterized protein YjiK